ncbi:MAG: glutamine-hydrolyzing GMP synthase [Anaerolineae bacterium]|nr:glutamine-hydrolyzing GMP synthase [Anaerolineae bacterium]
MSQPRPHVEDPSGDGAIAILDFGSQYSQLIARRVREAQVYCELLAHDTPAEEVLALKPRGFILSGGPNSVYDRGAPGLPDYVLQSGLPVLGICYGMQLLAHNLGGRVAPAQRREYGPALLQVTDLESPLFAGLPFALPVWMSHGDRIEELPPGFKVIAQTDNSPIAATSHLGRRLYGLQFHPEVIHTPHGTEIIRNFLYRVCNVPPTWTPARFVSQSVDAIREQVGDGQVLCALSGGVDSAVTATLVHRAVHDQLTCIFVDHGMLRLGEPQQVIRTFEQEQGMRLAAVHAVEEYLHALADVGDPEEKRRIIGEKFVRIFEREAQRLGQFDFLAQGTIYPDVIESAGSGRPGAQRIKTHHNVGGLPDDMTMELVEPLRFLFKDEVRKVGHELGLPDEIVYRQPFPGPGLAVRILGEITWERLETLRAADAIFRQELMAAGLLRQRGGQGTAQSFAVLLPVRSVGVMGDSRTYANVVALRAVTTDDFMTADWARLPYDLLARASNRIVNEVPGVNRVVYDVSSKPPATIEWE